MLRLLMDQPSLASEYPKMQIAALRSTSISGIQMLSALHAFCLDYPGTNTAGVLEAFRKHPHAAHLAKLLEIQLEDNLNVAAEYIECFKKLLRSHYETRLNELSAKATLSEGLSAAEQKELTLLLQKR